MRTGGKVIQIFQNADMRCSHIGLDLIAKKAKVKLDALQEGEYVVFFNTKKTHLKIAAANHVIAHKKAMHGRFYETSCIIEVVRAFHNTGTIEYDKALKDRLTKLLSRNHGATNSSVREA